LNPSRGTLPHLAACSAAYAVRLIELEEPDKVNDLRKWLYANQTRLDNDIILQELGKMGVSNPQNMFDPQIKQTIRADLQYASNYGIRAVPSVVLNGALLPPGLNPAKLGMLIEYERGNGDAR